MANTYSKLRRPFFVLSPMDDVTDTVFRQVVADLAAPDLFFTEFTNVDGLQSPGRPRLLKKLRFVPSETRLVAHIWGLKPENFYKTAREIADGTIAREVAELNKSSRIPRVLHGDGVQGSSEARAESYEWYGEASTRVANAAIRPKASGAASLAGRQAEPVQNFVGIDLNMGCPVKSEVNAGACSALINNRPLAKEIIQATKEGAAGKLPVSVKTRLGFNEVDLTWPEFLLRQRLAMLSIHCRTRKDMSKVPARLEYMKDIVARRDELAPDTLIVANGDIADRRQGAMLAEKYRLDGVMIGRGVFNDPFAFSPVSPWEEYPKERRIELYKSHVELFSHTWRGGERNIKTLNKFCKVYINGFDGAKELRERLMAADSANELLDLLIAQRA